MIMYTMFFSWLAKNPSKLTEEMFNVFKESFDIVGNGATITTLTDNDEKMMGMFDSVMFRCPECGNRIEEQSKVGDCLLHTFDSHEVPTDIAADIDKCVVFCENCKGDFVIGNVYQLQASVHMRLFKR